MRTLLAIALLASGVFAQAIPGKLVEDELPAESKRGEPLVYAIYAPLSYDASKPTPLILALHAGTGSARQFTSFLRALGEAQGALVAGPQGFREVVGADGYWWKGDKAELASIDRFVDHMKKSYKIDESRITLVGLADGAELGLKWVMAKERKLHGVILLNFLFKKGSMRADKELKFVLFACQDAKEKTRSLAKEAEKAQKALEKDKRPVVLRIMPGSSRSFFHGWEREFKYAFDWFGGKHDWPAELAKKEEASTDE